MRPIAIFKQQLVNEQLEMDIELKIFFVILGIAAIAIVVGQQKGWVAKPSPKQQYATAAGLLIGALPH